MNHSIMKSLSGTEQEAGETHSESRASHCGASDEDRTGRQACSARPGEGSSLATRNRTLERRNREPQSAPEKGLVREVSKTVPSLETMEGYLEEIAEYYAELEKLHRKLKSLKRGSEAYLDLLLGDLPAAAEILRSKCERTIKIADEILDSLPDDD